MRVLVTRPRSKAQETAARLRELGAEPLVFPTIAILPPESWQPLDGAVTRLSDRYYDWVIFTSTNGVRFFWQRLEKAGLDARALGGVRLAAIGPVTANALAARGLRADLVPQQYVAEAILDEIIPVRSDHVLLPRADIARPDLADGLRDAGAEVDEVEAYRTVPASRGEADRVREMLAAGEIDVLTFTSSSTVRNFAAAVEPLPELPDRMVVACIGPITASTATEVGLPVHVSAEDHTIPGLLDALVDHVRDRTS
jgi:uroporphyrinogen III methyltransferase/synthase